LNRTVNSKNHCKQILSITFGVKILVRKSRKEAQRMITAIAVLLRSTTWKCGRTERLVVNYLLRKIQKCGRAQTPIKEMLQHFKLSGKQKSEFLEALKRLEKRHIIRIEVF